MALQLLPILQIIVILCTPSSAYPVFGTKRYNGRTSAIRRANNNYSWGASVQPYQQFVRTQRFPVNYYEMYPYGRDYQEDYYYPQEAITYPVYIPPPRTSKYEVYQAVLPYYYGDRPVSRQDFGGYYGYEKNPDPVEDLEEEMLQEAEREEREDAQPIGQEVLYENEGTSDDNLDDVNAAFLQNLIMSQMYKDAANKQKDYYDPYSNADYYFDDDGYGRWDDTPVDIKQSYQDDEDVRELKQLAKPQKQETRYVSEKRPTAEERLHLFRKENVKNPSKNLKNSNGKESRYNWENKRDSLSANKKEEFSEHGNLVYGINDLAFSDRKPTIKPNSPSGAAAATTVAPKLTTNAPKKDVRKGQKEEVLMRPATPVRHPFSGSVLEMMKEEPERKREPSVYDTIKHMLDMEKSLENVSMS